MMARIRILAAAVVVVAAAGGLWLWTTAGREVTDDAQVDAHVVPIAARIGGTVAQVMVKENQAIEAGAVLVALDTVDYAVALDRARAELANAEAEAAAARTALPIAATTTTSNVTSARGGVDQSAAAVEQAMRALEVARARLASAQARQREVEANATRASKDADRLKGLLAKDEVSQQQFDAATAAATAAAAAVDVARAQVLEAQASIQAGESQLMQVRAGATQAAAQLKTAETAPQQVAATRARVQSAEAKVQQQKAIVRQAELNLEYATIKAPVAGIVSRKSVEAGQVIAPGQPLLAVVPLNEVWVTANFKETQLRDMRPGQRAAIEVDAYGGREFAGRVESLSAATGARFSLLPPDNATGNFVKVVQRVPVRIVLDTTQDGQQPLRPGMSVTARVFTK